MFLVDIFEILSRKQWFAYKCSSQVCVTYIYIRIEKECSKNRKTVQIGCSLKKNERQDILYLEKLCTDFSPILI